MNKKLNIQKNVSIRNKKATFNFELLDKFHAGLVLKGTEIKSIRLLKVSLGDSFCFFSNGELFIKNMNIAHYEQGTHYNHEPLRNRKLLLSKKELEKLEDKLKDQGLTIIPVKLFINDRGLAKMEIALAKGKKLHDKRESLKEKDAKRSIKNLI